MLGDKIDRWLYITERDTVQFKQAKDELKQLQKKAARVEELEKERDGLKTELEASNKTIEYMAYAISNDVKYIELGKAIEYVLNQETFNYIAIDSAHICDCNYSIHGVNELLEKYRKEKADA